MAEREIVWTKNSEIQLHEILDYFTHRNKSNRYSRKLYKKFKEELKLAASNPEIGVLTKLRGIKGLIVGDYILFYQIQADKIIVLKVWDSRQDPGRLNIPR
jgi:addiction module RelE/StbE family toxin